MGADEFMVVAAGATAQDAFLAAQKAAQWAYGHAGYTGTIAEKTSFVEISAPPEGEPEAVGGGIPSRTYLKGMTAIAYAQLLLDEWDSRIDDKWGPAGCVLIAPDRYLFFGWASS